MKNPNAEYVRTGGRAGRMIEKPRRNEPPPPESGFPGQRQCARLQAGGVRCPHEALPNFRLCALHHERHMTGRRSGLRTAPHARYAFAIKNPELRQFYTEARDDQSLKDSAAEIALAQAATAALLDTVSGDRAKFAEASGEVIKHADTVSRMQDRAIQQDILRGSFISRSTFSQIFLGLADLMITHIPDINQRQRLADAILQLIQPYLAADTPGVPETKALPGARPL